MYGKALPVGADWGSFSVEKSATFQQFPPGFQQSLRKKPKKKRGKALFPRKTVWKTRVKLWNNHFFAEKLVENHPFFTHCTAK